MYLESYVCALCNDHTEETLTHLFWDYAFARECWSHIIPFEMWHFQYDEICLSLTELPSQITMDIILMGYWGIRSIINDKIFGQAAPYIPTLQKKTLP